MKRTTALGPNSYAISCTQNTSGRELIQSILEICNLKNPDGSPKHGWEVMGYREDVSLTTNLGTASPRDLLALRSKCVDGRYKYAIFVHQLATNTITVISANTWDDDANWFTNAYSLNSMYRICQVTYGSTYEFPLGFIYHNQTIPITDRYDFFLFIHPRWIAGTVVPYSSEPISNRNFVAPENYGVSNFGLIGVFETFDSMNPNVTHALVNTSLALTNKRTRVSYWDNHLGGAAVDTTIAGLNNNSCIDLVVKGETNNASTLYSPDRGLADQGLTNQMENGKPKVTMLDMVRATSLTSLGAKVQGTVARIASIHGLKHTLASTRLMGWTSVKCDDENLMLDQSGSAKKHYVLPAWSKAVITPPNPVAGWADCRATFLLPA